ncbi:ankyrin repeat-containing domain protein, partial [Immersiella caudata]
MTPQQASEDLGFSLCRAARYGWVEVVEMLIELRAGVSARDKWGRSPLHYACEQGEFAIAKSLLANGADANSVDEWGGTPLLLATIAGADDIVSLLLKYDAAETISTRGGTRGSTPLIASVRIGNIKITKLLLSSGAPL